MKVGVDSSPELFELCINPMWAHLLPSPKIDQEKKETSIVGCAYSKVKPGGEPASLVTIKSGTNVIGMGARIKHSGKDYLLTANHVWNGPRTPTSLVKSGKAVDASNWECVNHSNNDMLDFALIIVPQQVWAALGVKSSTVKPLTSRTTISTYGGSSSTELLSGFGQANPSDWAWKTIHQSPTAPGWSGTPLYDRDVVVGLHLGFEEIGTANRACNIAYVLNCLLNKNETLPPDLSVLEIDDEDVALRSYNFEYADVYPMGRFKLGKREYARPVLLNTPWADAEDDMDFDNDEWYSKFKDAKNEASWMDEPLNCQRAEVGKHSPPSLKLQLTSSPTLTQSALVECTSTRLENRIVSLERCLEKILMKLSSEPVLLSPSSKNTDGQNEVPKPSFSHSAYKQESIGRQDVPAICKMPVKGFVKDTPDLKSCDASGRTIGQSNQFGRKQRRKRNQAKSTLKQAPGCPSQSWVQRTNQ